MIAHQPGALELMTIPGAVLGEDDVVLIVGRELVAGIELHAQRSDMRAELERRRRKLGALVSHGEFRVRNVALVAIRIAEVLADLGDVIELVARHVVAQPIARVLAEPVFPGARIDVAADAVAHAKRDDFRQVRSRD